MDSAKEQLKHLNSEIHQKDHLLKICSDGKYRGTYCDNNGCLTSNEPVPYSTLCKKVKALEEENARLEMEAKALHKRVTSTGGEGLAARCMHELKEAQIQMNELSRQLNLKAEECKQCREKTATLRRLIGDDRGRAKQLATENVELEEYLRTARAAQAELLSEIYELRAKYNDYVVLTTTLQKQTAERKQTTFMSATPDLGHAHTTSCQQEQHGSRSTTQLDAASVQRTSRQTTRSRSESTRHTRRFGRQRSRVNPCQSVPVSGGMMLASSLNIVDCFRVAFAEPLLDCKGLTSVFSSNSGYTGRELPAAPRCFEISGHKNCYDQAVSLHRRSFMRSSEYTTTLRFLLCFINKEPEKPCIRTPFEGQCTYCRRQELVFPSRLCTFLASASSNGVRVARTADADPAMQIWPIAVRRTRGKASCCSTTCDSTELARGRSCFFLRLLKQSLKACKYFQHFETQLRGICAD